MIPTTMQRITLPDDTKEALTEKGIEAPEAVILHLEAATGRERDRFEQRQKLGFTTEDEQKEWLTDLMMRRAESGTVRAVVRELVNDLRPTQITQFFYAYISGEAAGDPKVLEHMAEITKNQTLLMARPVLEVLALAGRSLSSPTTTA